jgi:putative peptidoglycan lipid II flippase
MNDNAKLHGSITKSAGVVAFFTTLSRIAGLIRDMVTFHVFGASATTDAFFVAFTIPNMLRRFVAEGALTVAFIPVYTEVRKNEGDAEAKRFYASTLGLLLIVLTLLVIFGMLGASYLVYAFASGFAENPEQMQIATVLTQWMFPYIFFISLVALFMGVLNSHGYFAAPAASPVFLNISMVGCTYWLAGSFVEPIFALAIGVLVGGVAQFVVQLPTLYRAGLLLAPTFDFNTAPMKKLMRVMFPSLFGIAVYQFNLIILRQLGSYLPSGQISYYYNADRLMQLALGIFAISIATAALPAMSGQTADGDNKALVHTWSFSTRLTNFITIPAAFGLTVIGIPIVSVLYLHGRYNWSDVQLTAYTTMAFAPGLISVAISRTTVQAFYALKDMRSPVIVGAMSVVVNLILGIALLRYEVVGLAISLTLSSWFQTILLLWWLRRRVGLLGGRVLARSMTQQTLLAAAMSILAWLLCMNADWSQGPNLVNIATLGLAIGLAMLVYGGGALLFQFDEAIPVKNAIFRRLSRMKK